MINKYLIGAILWALVILILTLTPGESVPDINIFSYDKLGHGFIFFILSFLVITGLYNLEGSVKRKNAILIGLLLSAFYGFVLEGIQSYIPGRSMDIHDAIANTIGSFLGLALFYLRNKYKAG